jgi:ATP-binding cassette subfamily G (WHITE) protein 2 (SNQ2)
MIASELFNFTAGNGGALEFKKSKTAKHKPKTILEPVDAELGAREQHISEELSESTQNSDISVVKEIAREISGSRGAFTWEDVEYTIPYMGGERKLLNKVNGYAKPGLSKFL